MITEEQTLVKFNLENVGVELNQEQLEIVEMVYSKRISEQKFENILYRLINVGIGLFCLFLTFIAYYFTAGFYPFLMLTVYFTATQLLNLVKLVNERKEYRKKYRKYVSE